MAVQLALPSIVIYIQKLVLFLGGLAGAACQIVFVHCACICAVRAWGQRKHRDERHIDVSCLAQRGGFGRVEF